MKYSLRRMMLAVFSFRDLIWLAVVVVLLCWWGSDRWVSGYMHQMFMRLHEGELRLKDKEIKELKELLKEQAPAQNSLSGIEF